MWVVNSAGTELDLVDGSLSRGSDVASFPSVSPDSSRIAYAFFSPPGPFPWSSMDNWRIVTVKADGFGQRRVTGNYSIARDPVWFPDGDRIALVAGTRDSGLRSINVANANPSGSFSEAIPLYAVGDHASGPPALSPDGMLVAFTTARYGHADLSNTLYVVGSDGSALTKLDVGASFPAWSPEGDRIAYAKREPRDGTDQIAAAAGIYTVRPDGADRQEIISFSGQHVPWSDSLSWSPDGSRLFFGKYLIATDESWMRSLPFWGISSWSPDGSRIALQGASGLYTVAVDGSDGRALVEENEVGGLIPAGGRPWP